MLHVTGQFRDSLLKGARIGLVSSRSNEGTGIRHFPLGGRDSIRLMFNCRWAKQRRASRAGRRVVRPQREGEGCSGWLLARPAGGTTQLQAGGTGGVSGHVIDRMASTFRPCWLAAWSEAPSRSGCAHQARSLPPWELVGQLQGIGRCWPALAALGQGPGDGRAPH